MFTSRKPVIRWVNRSPTQSVDHPASYDSAANKVTLKPSSALAGPRWYRGVVGSGVKDAQGQQVAPQSVPFAVGQSVRATGMQVMERGTGPRLRITFSSDVTNTYDAIRILAADEKKPAFGVYRVAAGVYDVVPNIDLTLGSSYKLVVSDPKGSDEVPGPVSTFYFTA